LRFQFFISIRLCCKYLTWLFEDTSLTGEFFGCAVELQPANAGGRYCMLEVVWEDCSVKSPEESFVLGANDGCV